MVAPHKIGQLRNGRGLTRFGRHQQGKQGAIQVYAGLPQQGVIALRAIEETHQVYQRPPKHLQITCILHLKSPTAPRHIPCMIHAKKILIICGSTRANRIGPQIAQWIAGIGRNCTPSEHEVIDLKDWPLPMDDEPGIPAMGGYAHEHTRAWSRKISGAEGFVFVTPQYNWGYPAPLKNALDHLYVEWEGKPAMIVSYGGHGGDKCARQLRQVLQGLKMKPVSAAPGLILPRDLVVANTGDISPAEVFSRHGKALVRAFGQLTSALKV